MKRQAESISTLAALGATPKRMMTIQAVESWVFSC
jgi:hypothetical protein